MTAERLLLDQEGVRSAFWECAVAVGLLGWLIKRCAGKLSANEPSGWFLVFSAAIAIFLLQPAQFLLARLAPIPLGPLTAGLGSVALFPCTFLLLHLVCHSARRGEGGVLKYAVVSAAVVSNGAMMAAFWVWGDPKSLGLLVASCGSLTFSLGAAVIAHILLERFGYEAVDRTLPAIYGALFLDSALFGAAMTFNASAPLDPTAAFFTFAGQFVGKALTCGMMLLWINRDLERLVTRPYRGSTLRSDVRTGVLAACGFGMACSTLFETWPVHVTVAVVLLGIVLLLALVDLVRPETFDGLFETSWWLPIGVRLGTPNARRNDSTTISETLEHSIDRTSESAVRRPRARRDLDMDRLLAMHKGEWMAYSQIDDQTWGPEVHLSELTEIVTAAGLSEEQVDWYLIAESLDSTTADVATG